MSVQAISWALGLPLPPSEKFVLVSLANHANGDGSNCYPSQGMIAAETSMTDRSVRTHLKSLEARGLITRRARMRKEGRGRSSDSYVLHLDHRPTNRPHRPLGDAEPADQPETLTARSGTTNRKDFPAASRDQLETSSARSRTTNRKSTYDQPENTCTTNRKQASGASSLREENRHEPSENRRAFADAHAHDNGFDERKREPRRRTTPRERDLLFEALVTACKYEQDTLTGIERGRLNKACKQLREVNATPEDVRRRAAEYRRRWPRIDLTPQGLVGNWSQLAKPQATDPIDDPSVMIL